MLVFQELTALQSFVRSLVVLLSVLSLPARAAVIDCDLRPVEDGFRGTCVDSNSKGATIHLLSGSSSPRFALRGTLAIEEGLVPVSVAPPSDEFYATGIVETPYRWLELTRFERTAEGLRFSFDWDREARPSALDLDVLELASKILSDPNLWDRDDDRNCQGTNWSLFCALMQATFEVMGEPHHRQPALQVVRREVSAVGADRIQSHRLMDFNNHPDTSFEEIRAVLRQATAKVRAAIASGE